MYYYSPNITLLGFKKRKKDICSYKDVQVRKNSLRVVLLEEMNQQHDGGMQLVTVTVPKCFGVHH